MAVGAAERERVRFVRQISGRGLDRVYEVVGSSLTVSGRYSEAVEEGEVK